MPPARRADLVRVVEKLGLPIIEDTVYSFLGDEAPLAALAPDSCIVLDSLSKKVAPDWRSVSSFHRRAYANASWPRCGRAMDRFGFAVGGWNADDGRRTVSELVR